MTDDFYRSWKKADREVHIEEHGPDGAVAWVRRPSDETLEQEEIKGELLKQHHRDHFEVPDPSDEFTDEELWEAMPESIRGRQS